jgi:RNA polymerase sigma-70 factor (ECF subfamily)
MSEGLGAFLDAIGPVGSRQRLTDQWARIWAQARSEHPGFAVSGDAFARHLATALRGAQPVEDALERLQTTDLYLACACLYRDPKALALLEKQLEAESLRAAARLKGSGLIEDLRQRIEIRLLVANEANDARLSEYRGLGSLAHWLRAIVAREAAKLTRRERPEAREDEAVMVELVAPDDPELELIRRRHGKSFRQAFEEAFAALTARQRTLLKMSILDRLGIDAIGAFYGTHRATAARWVAAAREALTAGTHAVLKTKLALSTASLNSLMRAFGGELEVSVRRVLSSPPG